MDKSATEQLAEFAANLSYERIPDNVVAAVKRILLDTLGTTIAATTLGSGCREVVEVMRGLGGKGESSILGYGDKTSMTNAAFINGAHAHALNYDPIGTEVGHVGVACLTSPLCVSEAKGGISGRHFLAATAVAAEVTARVTTAIARTGRRPSDKFLSGQLLNYFGSAAGAGSVLRLTPVQMQSAFGLALMQAAGSMQIVLAGDPPAKAIYGAFPNQGGVLAALLSKSGLVATCDVFEGKAGLFSMIYDGVFDAGALLDGLGAEFLLTKAQHKAWPTSGMVHPFIEGALQISRNGVRPMDIKSVHFIAHQDTAAWCEPRDERCRPRNPAAAANSIPFCVAKALCYGEVGLKDFTTDGIKDEIALKVAGKTSHSFDNGAHTSVVRVETVEGRLIEGRVPSAYDSRSISQERLASKFQDCCRYSASPLCFETVQALMRMIENLEDLNDVRDLPALMVGTHE